MIIFLLSNTQLQMGVRRTSNTENYCVRPGRKLSIFVFFLSYSRASFFFNLFNVLSSILFDFKVLIDWLAFRLDFMWYIGSHIDHRHRVTPHARSLCVINQTLKFSKFASSLACMMTLVMKASQSCVWSVL